MLNNQIFIIMEEATKVAEATEVAEATIGTTVKESDIRAYFIQKENTPSSSTDEEATEVPIAFTATGLKSGVYKDRKILKVTGIGLQGKYSGKRVNVSLPQEAEEITVTSIPIGSAQSYTVQPKGENIAKNWRCLVM